MSAVRPGPDAPAPVASTLDVVRRGWRSSPELRRGAAGTVALSLGGALGRVVVPVLVQQAIDRGLAGGDVRAGVVARLCAVGALAVVATAVATWVAQRRLARASESALYGLRTRAFAHIHRLSIAHHAEERRGALIARVTSDVEQMSQFFEWGGVAWLVNGAVMVAVVVTMAAYDWRLTVVALVGVLPLVKVLRVLQRRLAAAYDVVRARVSDMLSVSSEMLHGTATLAAYGVRERAATSVTAAVRAERDAHVRASRIGALMYPSGEVFAVAVIAAVVVAGLRLGPGAGLSAGELTGFLLLVGRFLEPVGEFTEILDHTQTAVAGWRRVLDVLDTPVDVADPDPGVPLPPGAPAVVATGVWFHYAARPGTDGEADAALADVTVTIPAGAQVAVVGPTGSGKTTFARLVARLADPTRGRITVGGVDLRDADPQSLRHTLVMVPQEPFLFDTTIAENVRFGRHDASDAEVLAAFAGLGLDGWVQALPGGLDTRVGERGDQLSAGERQLVALARASIASPACLVLDEATSAVDAATEARLSRAVEALAEGRTSITIAHRLSTAERADLVLVFEEGRLEEVGRHDELVRAGGPYARLHASWLDATAADR